MRWPAFVLGVILLAAPARAEGWRWEECRFQSLERPVWTELEEWRTARCALERFGPIPGGAVKLRAVGDCESSWWRKARNPGGYGGLFQHDLGAYTDRIRAFSPPAWEAPLSRRWTNSRGQIVMTVRMVRAGGWGPWTCA